MKTVWTTSIMKSSLKVCDSMRDIFLLSVCVCVEEGSCNSNQGEEHNSNQGEEHNSNQGEEL